MKTIETAAVTTLSIGALNLGTKCEQEFEFEYVNGKGKGTGVFITVLGSQAPKVRDWVRKSLNSRRSAEQMQTKRGKDVVRTVEDDEEFSEEGAAIRMTGWRGITEEFNFANALHLASINSEIRDQVFAASNDLANFTKA